MPLLTEAEERQLLVEWNDTAVEYPREKCVHELFEEQAARTPDAVAVEYEREQLTYAELDERANRLACYLRKLGVGPEAVVGICVERSPEMVVGVLAILKAGGAYLPMDPRYPEERLAFMMDDAGISVLLTQAKLEPMLPVLPGRLVCKVAIDRDWPEIAQESPQSPRSEAAPDNLAYVIYTSGSTGRPKGTLLCHRGVCNLAAAHARAFDVRKDDRVLQFASFGFDASVSEVFATLTAGATLVMAAPGALLLGAELFDLLRRRSVSLVTLPPTVLAALPRTELPALRTLVVAGEACPPEVMASWKAGRRFVNAYGPTEATVCATLAEHSQPSDEARCGGSGHGDSTGQGGMWTSQVIGRPMANTTAYLLDASLCPVPVGVPGEICVAGVGLARGYLGQAGQTAERFVPNPFGEEPGARLYRTGDLGRYLADGSIEYLGRIDQQVKVRGFRIEPGELEAALTTHPAVENAAVVVREDVVGDKRLCAYVVRRDAGSASLSVTGLREHLAARLPEHMIPSAIVFLQALPLTPSGKVDRKALPAPEARPELDEGYVAPRTPAERTLAQIWEEVLRVDKVGAHDNYFELGGDSILSIQVVARANRVGLRLAPRQLFEHPTVGELAALAGVGARSQHEQGMVVGAVALTPIQRWF
ncbi:MAG: amino acid adenylation domain-containing protein, partial [Pseudomonadota bacterium]